MTWAYTHKQAKLQKRERERVREGWEKGGVKGGRKHKGGGRKRGNMKDCNFRHAFTVMM